MRGQRFIPVQEWVHGPFPFLWPVAFMNFLWCSWLVLISLHPEGSGLVFFCLLFPTGSQKPKLLRSVLRGCSDQQWHNSGVLTLPYRTWMDGPGNTISEQPGGHTKFPSSRVISDDQYLLLPQAFSCQIEYIMTINI